MLIISLIVALLATPSWGVKLVPVDDDVGKDMTEMVTTRGYEIESHFVTTRDGYILNMFRIPYGKKSGPAEDKPVVLLQHGLLDSSYTWVVNYDDESLGYILADNGFDVWFGNNRGNRYGRNHTTLNPDDGTSEFWDFTYDEMALEDMPAMVNYVTEATGQSTIGWVGHSEGTIQMFAGASVVGDTTRDGDGYVSAAVSKINLFVALAPVAYVYNLGSELLVGLAHTDLVQDMYDSGHYEFLPYGPIDVFGSKACHVAEGLCHDFLDVLCGPSTSLNDTRIQVYVSGTPAGTSTRNMGHWMQGVLVDAFQMYDYGSDLNVQNYGTDTPPLYDLGMVKVPTALFAGNNDYMADPTDVQRMREELPADSIVHDQVTDIYAHLDYTWAYNANDMIYGDVTDLLKQYSETN